MSKKPQNLLLLLILILGFSNACIKDIKDLQEIEDMSYNPSFSVPIGSISYTLEEIMPPDSLYNFVIPDTIIQAGNLDTLILLYDDTRVFYRPELGYTSYFQEPVNFSTLSTQTQNVEYAMLKTIVSNKIPVAIKVQGYLLDASEQVVDSLIPAGSAYIPAPVANDEGLIEEPTEYTIYTHFYNEQVDALMEVTEIRVYVHLETYAQDIDTVKVYSENGLELQMALRGDLKIPLTY